ncbi:DUF6896 domain-containing protein [Rhodopirellula baltica]|uniref:DUF6896 domain-containing protein n=1 Tax=Rhodopirellula baltica WH47 TaxID=991778 RepID=F2AM58_RHOBT|nr:hypothetical protein [Rhodopirellula baltica]EGF29250.1 hypothetical protein RBWH47_04666 [Rhodopirellula baltica WH47]
MDERLKSLISSYRVTQDRALDYLHARIGLPLPHSNVEWALEARRKIESSHAILESDRVVLRKHGFGIDITHPEFRIDFDYGPNGERDCFDSWRLALFSHRESGLPGPVENQDEVSQWLIAAHEAGELIKIHRDYSHYVDPTRRSHWSVLDQNGG